MRRRRKVFEWTGYVTTSIRLDAALLHSPSLTWRCKLQISTAKYRSLIAVTRGKQATVRVGALELQVRSISDLGTLQSSIIDVQEVLVAAGVLSDTTHVHHNLKASISDGPLRRKPLNVVDVGANIGQFAAATLLAAPHTRMTCFEPDPAVFQRLEINLAGSGADLRCQALLAEPGQGTLYRNHLSVMSTMRPDMTATNLAPASPDTLTVSVTTLDDALSGPEPIDLLKIDVEGAEYDTLAGATQLLRRTRYLLVELSLNRATTPANMQLLHLISQICPDARILRTGRPMGPTKNPTCQDILIDLAPQ